MSEENAQRPTYWRSLKELEGLAAPPGLREFTPDFWAKTLNRRDFLKLMAASAALAGLTACRRPVERIVPFDEEPEGVIPGKPLFFATALTLGGYARGALVESHEVRPTKVEGNPRHPDSLGATDVFMQAAILDLYDPDRSQGVQEAGLPSTWPACAAALRRAAEAVDGGRGAGLRILTGATASPTLAAQIEALRRRYPELRWHVHEPAAGDLYAGTRSAFGTELSVAYRLERADVLVAFDANPLFGEPGSLACARAFGDRRDPDAGREPLRVYAAETNVSMLGACADHRLALRPSQVPATLAALAREIGVAAPGSAAPKGSERWLKAAAADLRRAGRAGLVVVGSRQPAEWQALGHAVNERLGSLGHAVEFRDRVLAGPAEAASSFSDLCHDLRAGRVAALLVLGCNPAYSAAPGDGFAEAAGRAPFSLHLGTHQDETAAVCRWHVPMAHPLESWGDARAFDGTASIQQPLIAPLYNGVGPHEVLSALAGAPVSAHDAVRAHWESRGLAGRRWDEALRDGVIAGTALSPRAPRLLASYRAPRPPAESESLEVSWRPSPSVWDGSRANNGWLMELPEPMSKLTWGDGAHLAPSLAKKLGVEQGDVLSLRVDGRSIELPAVLSPGHADGAVTVSLGYGRVRCGRVGERVGASAYLLRGSDAQWAAAGLAATRTGRSAPLPGTQGSQEMWGRDIIREATYERYKAEPRFPKREDDDKVPPTLYYAPPVMDGEHQWGMSIDLSRCIGCNACVIGCQAENNIPVVGAEQVAAGRHMHWIRIDRYYKGEADSPTFAFQPVPCMHCEHAPCEEVCPVGATVHSPEGLNEMVYNRCVGTRYCSNNCPYKVRRFNFFRYGDQESDVVKLARNPDVKVRELGVMEKCSYCIQRIQEARLNSEKENRPIEDGEIKTACQAACPTRAITFGDLADRKSRARKLRDQERTYSLLAELGTRPRTTYLGRVTNPKEEPRA